MAKSREMRVVLTVDSHGYIRGMGQASEATGKFGKHADTATKHAGRFHKGLRDVGKGAAYALGAGGFGGGMYALFDVVHKSIGAFKQHEEVIKQTNAALKSTHHAAGLSAKGVNDLATAISRKTGIDDEQVQAAENMLLSFTKIRNEAGRGNKIFNQASVAVTDLATRMNNGATPSASQLRSASIQLGKALQDPVKGFTALRRVGITLDKSQQAHIKTLVKHGHTLQAQKIILREVAKEFGGSARAANTPMKQLQVRLGDVAEAVGKKLNPMLQRGAKQVERFISQMLDHRGAGGRFVDTMKNIGQGAWAVAKPIGQAAVAVGKFAGHHPGLTKLAVEIAGVALAVKKLKALGSIGGILGGLRGAVAGGAGGAAVRGVGAGGVAATALTVAKNLGPKALGAAGLAVTASIAGSNAISKAVGENATQAQKKFRILVHGVQSGAITIRAAKKIADGPFGNSFTKAQKTAIHSLSAVRVAIGLFNRRNHIRIPVDTNVTKKGLHDVRSAFDLTRSSAGQDIRTLRFNLAVSTGQIRKTFGRDAKAAQEALVGNMRIAVRSVGTSMAHGKISVKDGMEFIRSAMRKHSHAGSKSVHENFNAARDAIRASMRSGVISTHNGMAAINRMMAGELKAYGFTGKEATRLMKGGVSLGDVLKGKDISKALGRGPQGLGGGGHARGGRVKAGGGYVGRRGEAGGDNVPIVVGRGEAILNRHQQPIIEAALQNTFGASLDDIFAAVRRPHYMASGGRVRGHAGGGYAGLQPGITKATRAVLRHFPGLSITAGLARSGHASNSYHYRGMATDIAGAYPLMFRAANWIKSTMGRGLTEGIHNPNMSIKYGKRVSPGYWGAQTWGEHLNHIHMAVAGGGGALGALGGGGGGGVNLKRLKVPKWTGPGGVVGAIGRGAVIRATQAANARIAKINATSGGAGDFGGISGGGNNRANMILARKMMLRMWPSSQWPALKALWHQESGFDNNARNPKSGAYGIPQALGHGHVFGSDPKAQIAWGLRYIKSRYGSPGRAWAHEQSSNWYGGGGFVGPGGVVLRRKTKKKPLTPLQKITGRISSARTALGVAALTPSLKDDITASKALVGGEHDLLKYWRGQRAHFKHQLTTGHLTGSKRAAVLRDFNHADHQVELALHAYTVADTDYRALPGKPFPLKGTVGAGIHEGLVSAQDALVVADADLDPNDPDSLAAARTVVGAEGKRVAYWKGRVSHWRERMHNKHLSAKQRKAARKKYRDAVNALGEATGDYSSAKSDLEGRVPEAADTTAAEDTSAADLAQAMKDLTAEIAAQRKDVKTIADTSTRVAIKALADQMSGQMGYSANARARTPNAGLLARY